MASQATPQKKPGGEDVHMQASPAAPTPGQTPIKSPALKKVRGAERPIPEEQPATIEVFDSQLTEVQEPDAYVPVHVARESPDSQPEPTPTSPALDAPELEVPSNAHPDMTAALDRLQVQYRSRIASILELKQKQLKDTTDPEKAKFLEEWADKQAQEAQRSLDRSTEAVFIKYEGIQQQDPSVLTQHAQQAQPAPFNYEQYAADLSRELGPSRFADIDDMELGKGGCDSSSAIPGARTTPPAPRAEAPKSLVLV